ncbi:Superkiller viralicidic activity 2-like 2-like [Oopsacas minuta]|uniref:Superkiller viralicidic activity 2-like 2-like n=1 Tax=Oopsacas minuta TaxID=111878 RepID=A0AAV7JS76_9METZ|nr:Superkiller viralicidic activity 2-like 2-like [Oopsacas minuta]
MAEAFSPDLFSDFRRTTGPQRSRGQGKREKGKVEKPTIKSQEFNPPPPDTKRMRHDTFNSDIQDISQSFTTISNNDTQISQDFSKADSSQLMSSQLVSQDVDIPEKLSAVDKVVEESSLGFKFPRAAFLQIDTGHSGCVHEVSVPQDIEYAPLVPSNEPPLRKFPFKLDPFQQEAIDCLEGNHSVLVSAHTSAGKTAVAEYAIALSLKDKQRVIYTTPIKALSNQKYREMLDIFADVGLMTGDVTINPSASVLVMTTEILRNMLYRGSEVMREVGWVIFDEIHYMRDKDRGVVWEETIILLPDNVHYVFLSATIPNARQFAEWVSLLHKQPVHVVYTDQRPVPLQHYIFPGGGDGLYLVVNESGEFLEENFQKAMAILSESSESKGKKQSGFNKGGGSVEKILESIMEKKLQPVIVFSFSRRECESYALQLSKMDFNTSEEKKLVQAVFHNAIAILNAEDKQLPQIENVLPLLKRGVGIHHSGLLPILKEIIEILFGEGLLKVLFATETFSLGLNMPARTVVFARARKFDGEHFRWLNSGEYIQMSGRAGRRGLDDRGIVMLMVDEHMDAAIGRSLLQGDPHPLNSAFHQTYNMVLNLLRVDGINPEYILERSFHQFQNNCGIPELETRLQDLDAKKACICIRNEDQISSYYKIKQQIDRLKGECQKYILKPQYCLPYFQPGRMLRVTNGEDNFGWGAVINFHRKANPEAKKNPKSDEFVIVVEVLLSCTTESVKKAPKCPPEPAKPGEPKELQVIPVLLEAVADISVVRLYLPDDIRSVEARRKVERCMDEVANRFNGDFPKLDPILDMNIKEDGFKELDKKIKLLQGRLESHQLHDSLELEALYAMFKEKERLQTEAKQIRKDLKLAESVQQMDELKRRKRVLRRLGYASANDVIEMKGRVACEISSGDELLLTEMIFNGAFNSITPEQCVAILSCFVFQEKCDEQLQVAENLSGPLKLMQQCARRIGTVSVEAKMAVDEQEYVNSFKPHLMGVVYSWAKGAHFGDICKMTSVFEGSIIRCMRRLEELLREMAQAAKTIGNEELEQKFNDGTLKIKRDIVFAASLYL